MFFEVVDVVVHIMSNCVIYYEIMVIFDEKVMKLLGRIDSFEFYGGNRCWFVSMMLEKCAYF
jgi:hypothetical protein